MISILIADDSKVIRSNMKKILNQLGYFVIIEACDGEDAVKRFQLDQPCLTFLDVSMPNKNGLETLKEIKEIDSTARIIMATTHGEERIVMEAISNGASSYVLKPITYENVKCSIDRVLPDVYALSDA